MTPLTSATLHGVWGSALLPIADDDSIDWVRLAAELEVLAGSDLDGVYAHGTAGEFHTLDADEFDRISRLLATTCERAGMPFQIGVNHPVPRVAVERIARTRDLGPGAYQVVLPDWLPLTDRECEAFLRRVAAAADPIPLVLYNPPHAKTRVGPALAERLLDAVPTLVGLKVVPDGTGWYDAMRSVLVRCAVFVPGHQLASGLAQGARGSYSNVAAMSPTAAARWYALTARDPLAARDVERRIAELFGHHVEPLQRQGLSNPALDKFLAALGGWCDLGLRVRWPYDAAPAEAVEPARRAAHDLLPDLMGA